MSVFLAACGGNGGKDSPIDAASMPMPPDGAPPHEVSEVCAPEDIVPCTPRAGDGDTVIVRGTVIAPDSILCSGDVAYSRSTGKISCVGKTCDVDGASMVCADVVSPGLIDAHNHMQYNPLPRFHHEGILYRERGDWQKASAYKAFKKRITDIGTSLKCEIMKWA